MRNETTGEPKKSRGYLKSRILPTQIERQRSHEVAPKPGGSEIILQPSSLLQLDITSKNLSLSGPSFSLSIFSISFSLSPLSQALAFFRNLECCYIELELMSRPVPTSLFPHPYYGNGRTSKFEVQSPWNSIPEPISLRPI